MKGQGLKSPPFLLLSRGSGRTAWEKEKWLDTQRLKSSLGRQPG